ncbi:MAG: molybdopterin-dependent oxidoreductase [Dehalococcoidia bacterium]|nr:molybdopterin-dependent oxidoreductase [Dehalococcoidia bacterium]
MKLTLSVTSIVTLTIVTILVIGCAIPPPAPPDVGELPDSEIREYQGENLGSIDDFRENSISGPQYVDVSKYVLTVHGLVENEKTYSYDDVVAAHDKYKKVVTLDCVEGWSVKLLWEGVLISDILDEVGVLPEAKVVIFRSYDHYSTSFPLDYLYDNDILMAHKMNEVLIPPERGFPFQVVAESKWGYKWIKWVNEIELSDDETYEGYWEQRGYSNIGDTEGPMFS